MRALRVVVYTRLSRDPDGTSTAVARQEAECRALAEREGWLVTHVLSDSDFSAWDPRVHRPGFQALLDLVAGAQVDAVLTWKLDRLSRQPGQFEALIAICQQAGARILSATEPADITTPLGLAMLRVGMAMAAAESDSTRLRVRAQKAEAARDGLPNGGGLRPFGLEPSRRVVVPAEAALVREGVRRVLDGETLTAICRSWNRRGISTTRGNEWTVTTLRRMLTAPHIAGLRRHRDAVIESEVIPAIVDRATWERVRAMLTDPARLTVHERTFRALSGLVRCSRCGTVMRARYRHDGRAPLYRCLAQPGTSGCGRMSIAAEPLEALVAQMVAAALDGEGLRERLARGGADTAGARQELADLAVRRQGLVHDHHVTGLVSRGEFTAAVAVIDDRICRLEAAIARQQGAAVLATLSPGSSVAAAWERHGPGWRRELVAAVIERVLVLPAPRRGLNRFDPGRVRVVWRE